MPFLEFFSGTDGRVGREIVRVECGAFVDDALPRVLREVRSLHDSGDRHALDGVCAATAGAGCRALQVIQRVPASGAAIRMVSHSYLPF